MTLYFKGKTDFFQMVFAGGGLILAFAVYQIKETLGREKSALRKLNLFDGAMISSGAGIGSGIFMNSAESAKFLRVGTCL